MLQHIHYSDGGDGEKKCEMKNVITNIGYKFK